MGEKRFRLRNSPIASMVDVKDEDVIADTNESSSREPIRSAAAGKLLKCEWNGCHLVFSDANLLYHHLCDDHIGRKCHKNLTLRCHWGDCQVSTVKRDHITSHVRVHIPLKPYSCSHCTKRFKRPQDLKKHLKTHSNARLRHVHQQHLINDINLGKCSGIRLVPVSTSSLQHRHYPSSQQRSFSPQYPQYLQLDSPESHAQVLVPPHIPSQLQVQMDLQSQLHPPIQSQLQHQVHPQIQHQIHTQLQQQLQTQLHPPLQPQIQIQPYYSLQHIPVFYHPPGQPPVQHINNFPALIQDRIVQQHQYTQLHTSHNPYATHM